MKKKYMKKIVCMFCIFSLVAPMIPTSLVKAASGEVINDNTTSMEVEQDGYVYSFDHSYVKPGDTLKLMKKAEGAEDTKKEQVTSVTWTIKKMTSGSEGNQVSYKTVDTKSSAELAVTEDYLECLIYGETEGVKLTIYCSKTPVMYINSETDYYSVTKDTYTNADTTTINLVGNDTYSDSKYWYNGTGQIKLRGNSTSSREKRPFKLKLSKKADLLNLGEETQEDGSSKSVKSKHWVLLANDIDHSLIRNKLLYDFSGDIGTEFYFHSTNVTLIYNGQYEGVYQLCEHRRVDEGRIDITDWTGIGETAAETIADSEAEKNGWSKDYKKEFLAKLEESMASDYSWMNGTVNYYDGGTESVEEKTELGTIRNADYGTNASSWQEKTGDFEVTYQFVQRGTGDKNQYNFVAELTSDNERHYLTSVCNGGSWWYDADTSSTNCWGTIGRDGVVESLNAGTYEGDTSILSNANVTLTIKRTGNKIDINADLSGVDDSSKTATYSFSAESSNANFPEKVKVRLTGAGGITISDIVMSEKKEKKKLSATYKLADYGITLPNQTGGYLAEMDFYSIGDSTLAGIGTNYQQPLYFSAPEPGEDADTDDEKTSIVNNFKKTDLYQYAKNYTQTFEYALHSDDFFFRNSDTKYATSSTGDSWMNWKNASYSTVTYKDSENDGKHYSELFDMDSLVNNFIFCEYAMNWDSMKNSFFYYKEVDQLAKIGPQWDFDWCWGNINMYNINTNYPTSWQTTEEDFTVEQYYQTVQWNRMLIRDPYFLTKAYEKYQEIRPIIENMIKTDGLIDQYKEYLLEAGRSNDTRWSYTYSTKYSGATSETFEKSIASIKTFLNKRVAWLDKQFTDVDTLADSLGYYKKSDDITLKVYSQDSNVVLEAATTNSSAKKIRFQINGTTCKDASVTDGTAKVVIAKSSLDSTALNTVVANEMNSSGSYIKNSSASVSGNYNVVKSDYEVFYVADLKGADQSEDKKEDQNNVQTSGDSGSQVTTTNSTTAVSDSASSKKGTTTVKKPAKVKKLKVSSKKKKTALLLWKKISGASGYQIQYAASKKMKSSKKVTTKKVKVTIKKLKSKKKYYFRVRAYKIVNGKKVYGAWSAVKKVKVK